VPSCSSAGFSCNWFALSCNWSVKLQLVRVELQLVCQVAIGSAAKLQPQGLCICYTECTWVCVRCALSSCPLLKLFELPFPHPHFQYHIFQMCVSISLVFCKENHTRQKEKEGTCKNSRNERHQETPHQVPTLPR
jgi:hypothetical protein